MLLDISRGDRGDSGGLYTVRWRSSYYFLHTILTTLLLLRYTKDMPLFQAFNTVIQMQTATDSPSAAGQVWFDGTHLNINIGGTVYQLDQQNTIPSLVQSSPSRSLNTVFTPSTTSDTLVNYSVSIATSLSLTTGQQGTVVLQISPPSTAWQTIASFTNGQTGTLTIGLALTQTISGTLSGTVPAGYKVQMVTTNNTGTPTFAVTATQESTTI